MRNYTTATNIIHHFDVWQVLRTNRRINWQLKTRLFNVFNGDQAGGSYRKNVSFIKMSDLSH